MLAGASEILRGASHIIIIIQSAIGAELIKLCVRENYAVHVTSRVGRYINELN